MIKVSLEEARRDLGLLVTRAADGEHIAITKYGIPAAVLVSWRDYPAEENITATKNICTA